MRIARRSVVLASSLVLFTWLPALRAQKLTLAPTHPAAPASLEDRRKALNDVFHDFWEDTLKHDPELASALGDNRYNDQITDYSVAAINDQLAREQNFLMRLAALDSNGFTDQEKLSQQLLERRLEMDQEAAEFKEWEMPVTQIDGIYATYPELVAELTFATAKDYDDWIARLHAIPRAFEQVTHNMEIGMEDNRVPPRFLLEKALAQVSELAHQKPEDSPLALPLKKFPAAIPATEQQRIRTEMLDAIAKEDLPAYQRFERFMRVSYVPAGRSVPGIDALPDGAAYYRFLIKRVAGVSLPPDQLHQIGLDQVKEDRAAMLAIAEKLGFKDLASFQASLKTNPKLHPASAEALLNAYRGYLAPMEAKLPQLFGRLPKAKFEVLPVPEYMAPTAPPAYYEAPAPDGSRPGRLRINTYDAAQRNFYDVEAIAYHEGIPGHHLQISIAQELPGLPDFRRYLAGSTAYTEGWGLYAEQLGKDVGFYQDPYSDYGRLESDLWRAIRLVVDTGVHSQHWTRQQMVDYFHQNSAIDEPSVQSEVDRYIAWPAQALAYKARQMEILEQRAEAQKALGPKFDLRAYHDEVLDSGPLPLDMLQQRVEAWISAQAAGVSPQ